MYRYLLYIRISVRENFNKSAKTYHIKLEFIYYICMMELKNIYKDAFRKISPTLDDGSLDVDSLYASG